MHELLLPVFVDPDGDEWTLDADLPVVGRWAPPVTHLPDGTVRHDPRDIPIRLEIAADGEPDPETFHNHFRAFVAAVDPARGDGLLRWPAPDGTWRELVCRYLRGLEAVEDVATGASLYVFTRQVAVFRTVDPYWRDIADTTLTVERGAGQPTFFPFPPLELVSGSVFAAPTVDNDGDVDAWPVWTVTGPATAVTIRNDTTGRTIDVVVELAAGETLEVDTRPGIKTVTDGTGANRFGALSAASSLWPLARGDNDLTIELAGATDDSSVELAWRRRWLTV